MESGIKNITPQKIKNVKQKSNLMPEIGEKIKNGNQKCNLVPEIPKKVKKGNQKTI